MISCAELGGRTMEVRFPFESYVFVVTNPSGSSSCVDPRGKVKCRRVDADGRSI